MSTQSLIGIENLDGTVLAIYCHLDGYPSHNGALLLEHYNTEEKVRQLLALGSLSVLAESMECPEGHSFDHPKKGYCIAYGRDRGEEDTDAESYISIIDLVMSSEGISYLYVFRADGWHYKSSSSKDFQKIWLSDCEE